MAAGGPGAGRTARFLGRSLVLSPTDAVPAEWSGLPRIAVHAGLVPDDPAFRALEDAYFSRSAVVIDLEEDLSDTGETENAPIWTLSPDFTFPGERLRHLVWTNSLDGRSGELVWELTRRAVQLGASLGTSADVVLPDGRPAFLDGGPLEFFDSQSIGVPGAVVIHRIALEHGSLEPLRTNSSSAELAVDQLAAVTHNGGAARIIAPAGSGKTRVLTERARHLLQAWRIPPAAVCLVAFNKRAADEIRHRTSDFPQLQVRTLNSLALAIVSGSGRFGSSGSVETVDERAVRSILEGLVSFPRRVNADPAAAWIEALSAVRLGLRSPSRVESEFGGDVDGLAEVVDRYRQTLQRKNVLDFDEQIYRAVEILLTDPQARAAARKACRLMLVDEFQDLTPAHLLLIRLLAGPDGCVFGVGDDDQTIYGYAGASPEWLIDYASLFPGAASHNLEVNYRCPPLVVAAARTLLTHNRRRVKKTISAAPLRKEDSEELDVLICDDPVQATVGAVQRRMGEGADASTTAVLTRVNSSLAPIQLSLGLLGIPANQAVDARYMERTGIRAALAWLRLAGSRGPDQSARRAQSGSLKRQDIGFTARRPPRALSPKIIEWMSEQKGIDGLRSLAQRVGERDSLKVNGYADDLELLIELAETSTTEEFFEGLRDRVGLSASLAALDSQHRRLDRTPQADDLDVLIDIAKLHPATDGFEDWLRNGLSVAGDPHGVVLATVHSVKGREWNHVIVHGASLGLMPHRLAEDVEEERRVFHVAITRARRSVTVVSGASPSPFLAELQVPWVASATPEAKARPARPGSAAGVGLPDGLVPTVGMTILEGGYAGIIESIDAGGVIVRAGLAVTRISFGRLVKLEGVTGRLLAPGAPPEVREKAAAALRLWRLERSRAEGKPAYTLMHDSTLEAVAESGARSLGDLARIKGIGPAKLESFGDELLAILDAAGAPAPAP